MRIGYYLVGITASTLCVHGQHSESVKPDTNALLEESIILDQAEVLQGNTLLKIERLSTPDEELIKELEGKKITAATPKPQPDTPLNHESYFISATVYDDTYTLLKFKSLSRASVVEAQAWTNIISWDQLGASPVFVLGETQYTMMILPSAAQVTDESPALPTNLPSLLEGDGAYYQELGEETLKPSEMGFMEALHVHYELRKNQIKKAHQKKIVEQEEKLAAQEAEARRKKTVTLRFWRQKDRLQTPEATANK